MVQIKNKQRTKIKGSWIYTKDKVKRLLSTLLYPVDKLQKFT